MQKVSNRDSLRKYFNLVKKYKWNALLLALTVFITEVLTLSNSYIFKYFTDECSKFAAQTITSTEFISFVLIIGLIYLGVQLLYTVNLWFKLFLLNLFETNLILDVKKKFFNHIIDLSYKFFITNKTGALISSLLRGTRSLEEITDVFALQFLDFFFRSILIFFSLVYLDWRSLVIISLIVFVYISYALLFNKKMVITREEANKADDQEKAIVSDNLTNVESIKYFGKEEAVKRKYAKLAERTSSLFFKNWNLTNWRESGLVFISEIGLIILLYFSVVRFLAGETSLGNIIFLYTVYGSLLDGLYSFSRGLRTYQRGMTDFSSLSKYDAFKNEIIDKPNAKPLHVREPSIEFKDVYFAYNKKLILNKFNLKVEPYKKIAIVGPSGSGKTTVIRMLYRLFDVDSGQILVNGKDIKDFEQESLRSEMSIVPQECILFDDTLYHNIKFSNPSAKREDVLRAIRLSQLDKVIAHFPNGVNTIVGERGVRLSGGEKQRVSIARAILADKKILVLDEATSALDSKTEFEIKRALDKLMEKRTCIIIAHRLSTIMNADLIVVMDKGHIVQMGRHSELIRQEGKYRRLWNLQKGGYIK